MAATLAVTLKTARKRKKMSMNEVERRANELKTDPREAVTQGYLSRLESGKETNPSLMKLRTLRNIYQLKPKVFF